LLGFPPLVARRPLRPQLNQIRTWVRQGRTDAWIAHQLEVTVKDIEAFKREHALSPGENDGDGEPAATTLDEEPDMRAEDDALVAAELDAMSDEEEAEEEAGAAVAEEGGAEDAGDGAGDSEEGARRRRRGRRGGRRRRGGRERRGPLEGTFDHGEEGYGLWLDPAVQDDAVYAEHWAGHRMVTVEVEPDRIVIRRRGDTDGAGEGEGEDGE
jgi:hypothetical protein